MELADIIRGRRSIRKYEARRVEKEKLDAVAEAGLYAPNPGGRQGSKIIMLDDPALIDSIGIVNADCENRHWDVGVSSDQPSIIDDQSIRSGFYGCAALAMVCIQRERRDQVNQIGAAFVCAQNMVLRAYDLGLASVIVGRAEATFERPGMRELLDRWGLDPAYLPIVFVCLGYIRGGYPPPKARLEGRYLYVPENKK